ncbi:hypothetical protein M405DRAFT_813294 [Rhizopogon salebrosus TDB-379]|nr:hypothetical protein M405DRAFT_813294 [Rhizopogon salebrosus TDB-379]
MTAFQCGTYNSVSNALHMISIIAAEGRLDALMILTVYERFHFYKDRHTHLVTTIYRDGLVYMACIIMASVANIFVGLLTPVRLYAP